MHKQSLVGSIGLVVLLLTTVTAQPSPPSPQKADVNADGIVNAADVAVVQQSLQKRCGQAGFNPAADVNGDCVVNVSDVAFVSRYMGQRFPPTIAGTVAPPANTNGWHKTDATVSFTCTGVSPCPGPVTVSSEGAGQAVDRTVSNAGGSATAHVLLNIDKTAPTIAVALPPPPAGGIYDGPVTPHFTCTDLGSGIATCPPDQALATPGVNLTVTGMAVDRAGNAASVTSEPFAIQAGAPTITVALTPAQNSQGWNNTPVTAHFTCMAGGFPLAGCPANQVVATEGANQTVTGTVTDAFGASATVTSPPFNIDLGVPSITVALSPVPISGGYLSTPITAHFACEDTGSGVDACPPDKTVTLEGPDQTVTGTVFDKAGNSASVTSSPFSIDLGGPSIVASLSPSPNGNGWNHSPVTVHFTCSDAGSGVATCPSDQVVTTEGANQTIAGLATDHAGNTTTTSATVSLDMTPPALTLTSPADGATVLTPAAMVVGTVTDPVSGLASTTCNGAAVTPGGSAISCSVTFHAGSNAITATARDLADNTSSASLTVNYTALPTIVITSPQNLDYLNISPTTVTGTVDDSAATVSINSISAPVVGGMFSIPLPIAEGPNIITATATTAAGVSTASATVTLDTTPPHVTITSPSDQFVTTDSSISIAGNVNDIVVGTVNDQQAQVVVNGVAAQVANRTFLAGTVPLAIGPNTVQAVARDRGGNAATTQITVVRQVLTQSQIVRVSGNGQTGAIGSLLAQPLVVGLVDGVGAPVPNRTVIFKVTQNDGVLTVAGGAPAVTVLAQTDSQGQARAGWTLGGRAGAGGNVVEAYAVGFEGTAIFTAVATQGTAGKIVVDTGNDQIGPIGQALPKPFIAVVVDSGNNRLAGVPVTFTVQQGGGTFDGQTASTVVSDSDGRVAATLTLGLQEGSANNLVEANFPFNVGVAAAFTASGRAPGNPVDTTISGVVLDNSNAPVPGVTVRAVLTTAVRSSLAAVAAATAVQTDAQGQFTIPQAPVGLLKLMLDGTTAQLPGSYPSLEYDIITVAGQHNDVGQPIYLLPLSTANQLCVTATTGGGTLTIPEAPGFSLTFTPGQVTFPGGSKTGCVSVTVVNGDKVPMVPGFGQQPRFIVTIQPAGAIFNPPAPITIPNVDGLKPRAVTEMYSYDHDIGSFVAIGTGIVSDDGQVIRSAPGVGVLKAGWHCGGDPAANGTVADCGICNLCVSNACQPDNSQTPPQASPSDCLKQVCLGGSVSNQPDNSEVPVGPPPVCKKLTCSGGAPLTSADAAQEGLNCVDGPTVGTCKAGVCSPAIPVNFHQTGWSANPGGVLHFDYVWDSSTGNLADLSKCQVGERVTYPGGNPFIFPSPPWDGSGVSNPTIIMLPATNGAMQDNHSSVGFLKPYAAASVTSNQDYRYACTDVNGGLPVVIESHAIVRTVSQNPNSSWKYVITKNGASNSINPLP